MINYSFLRHLVLYFKNANNNNNNATAADRLTDTWRIWSRFTGAGVGKALSIRPRDGRMQPQVDRLISPLQNNVHLHHFL